MKTEEKVCPNCGFCPTCKRPNQIFSPYPVYPYPVYPWYWTYPYQYPNTTYIPLTGDAIPIDTSTGTSSVIAGGTVSLPGIATTAGNDYGPSN
ncbi:hypothetical protein LCGC14_1362200 [marine sediment metagenome]|uniref:Uncharacterized protein n=1 Tax=marine sediment metagenome TaxID=412755 RepID=A0A0F9K8D4_9ZZZZ